jgi:hypothetical protein
MPVRWQEMRLGFLEGSGMVYKAKNDSWTLTEALN